MMVRYATVLAIYMVLLLISSSSAIRHYLSYVKCVEVTNK